MGAAAVIKRVMKSKFPFLFLLALLAFWRFDAVAAEKLSPKTEARIRAILDSPKLASAHVGLSVLDLGTVKNVSDFPPRAPIGKPFRVLFESAAQKKFMPASNMKLFTAAIALHLLGKDKTFPTRIMKCPPTPSFHWDSYLLIGDGDPSLDEDGLNDLATQVAATGIKKIRSLRADGSAFGGETFDARYPFGWTLDDIIWYYGAPVRSLAYNRNQFDAVIVGGEKQGDRARCEINLQFDDIFCQVTTGADDLIGKSGDELLHVEASTFRETFPWIIISGQVAPKQKVSLGFAVQNPSGWAAQNMARALEKSGVDVGSAGATDFDRVPRPPDFASACELVAQHNSPPLEILLQRFLKKSDNLYAEMLLRDAAYYHDAGKNGTAPRAHELLKTWLIAQNIDVSDLRFEDGSGLSRYNLLTPRATAQLLAAINRMPEGAAIWNALPIAGVDGTLKNRMQSTPGMGNVRAKTGTFSIASNLSGYVTTRDKKRLAVSLYVNFARDTVTARWAQDAIFTALASGEIVDEDVK
jgi:D-alanyl-D-alanine carboxypeptidase/D-alanyl-D-alanine-endopeptidase (penicillin-binding protein 4)